MMTDRDHDFKLHAVCEAFGRSRMLYMAIQVKDPSKTPREYRKTCDSKSLKSNRFSLPVEKVNIARQFSYADDLGRVY